MNKFSINKNIIVEKEIDNPFCKKFFSRNKLNKCVMFLLDNEKRGQIVCPYSYLCAKSVDTIYCGFIVDGCVDIKKIKGHTKFSGGKKIERYTKEEYNIIWEIAHLQDCCSVYSQTAHDLIHFSGQLKSLIDEAFQYSQQDKFISHLIKEYQKYITLIDGYRKKSEDNSRHYNNLNDKTIQSTHEFFCKKIENYSNLISSIYDVSSRISTLIGDIQADEQYKGKYNLISLISMQSLFDYRIKYHEMTMGEFFDSNKADESEIYNYNWHRIAKKLTNMLYYQAKAKHARFVFDGTTRSCFLSKESVYLALYILLENSIKYSNNDFESLITLRFEDTDNECLLSISNPSEFISEESLMRITEKGFSGENSNKSSSNGIGLYVVKRIFEDNNIKAHYSYKNNSFIASLACLKNKEL